MKRPLRLITGTANVPLAKAVARRMRHRLEPIIIGRHNDGEVRAKLTNVREADVFIIQPMDPRDHAYFMELLVLAYTAVSSSAGRITGVIPYFGYARQDRKDQPRVGIQAKLVADIIQVAGYQRLICVDLHAAQIQGFFDPKVCVVDHLYDRPVMIRAITRLLRQRYHLTPATFPDRLVFVAPDSGATKMVAAYAERLNSPVAYFDKRRNAPGSIKSMRLVGDVRDRIAVVLDDTVDTAWTLCSAATTAHKYGARHVIGAGVHPLLSGEAIDRIERSPLETVLVSDSLILPVGAERARIQQVSMAPLLADAIHRTYTGCSLSPLIN